MPPACRLNVQQRTATLAHTKLELSAVGLQPTFHYMSKPEIAQMLKAIALALENEKRLLALTKDKPPGHPEHNQWLWREMLNAMEATYQAKKALQSRERE